jgi:Flp pilus assembly protein TadG
MKKIRWTPSGSRSRGQSLTEFALLLPVMLALVGAMLDVARAYQASIALNAATRDAAEYTATNSDSAANALSQARRVVCLQAAGLPGHVPGGTPDTCSAPDVTVVSFSRSTTVPGSTTKHPLATVTVRTELPFDTLFDYPFVGGDWTLGTDQTFSIVQNR